MEEVPTSVLSAERCHLGEGPTYDASTDTAWWFDIRERRLFEHRFADGRTIIHALPKMASALARIDGERQLILTEDGLYVRQVAGGRLELFAALEADNAVTRSNDARVHPSGTFWLGTMGRQAEQGAGAIYALHRGRITRLYPGITIPNAMCFSPAGDVGYFADTATNVLHRVPLDPATGLPTGEPIDLIRHQGVGGLDGAIVDADGMILNARWGGGCVDVYDPSGRHLRSLKVPAKQSSCPAFVGRDFSRVLVTSAWQDMDEAQRAADPGHGQTFLLDAAARGRAEPDVKLS
ncbi:SMP-30/gluconolactonase/LRE family protein [Bradyrhizobium sp. CER78]|uniref:SMP-30/gluconolactonase/LRE family protein n=1 Tax=Bradyrhizobium sp. CER78 TaxID=3039162 RepID=UPI0024470A4A|nr:SMP-30/gluconolactonase/LRE family protein [Bradyrhizobium sp. CER78]MDH2383954.1 SMP-30/gluconolactonase/LRE family protein [Bradyrhizobium sp. CER78]